MSGQADAATGRASPTARLFLALWPDPRALGALCHWRDGWSLPPTAVPVPAERLHLTLHFIGPVPLARLPEISQGLSVPCAPFGLEVGQAQVWPRGLAVVCPRAVPAALADLHQRLAGALQRLALPVEARPWRPHVTLARQASGAAPPAAGPAGRWQVRGYALVQSQGGYRGLRHYPASPGS